MHKRANENKYYLMASIFIAIFIAWVVAIAIQNLSVAKNFYILNKGWSVSDSTYEEAKPIEAIDSFGISALKSGESLSFYNTLEHVDVENPEIIFYTNYCVTTIKLDGEKIYEAGITSVENREMIGDLRNEAALPNDYEGKLLEINITADRDRPMSYIESVAVVDATDSMTMWFNRPLSLTLFGFLLIGAAFLCMVGSFSRIKEPLGFFQMMMLSAGLFFSGLYVLCRAHVMELLIDSPSIVVWIEYFSLFTVPFALSSFVFPAATQGDEKTTKIYKTGNIIYLIIYSIMLIEDFIGYRYLCCNKHILLANGVMLNVVLLYVLTKNIAKYDDRLWIKSYIQGIIVGIIGSAVMLVVFATSEIGSYKVDVRAFYNYSMIFFISLTLSFFIRGLVLRIKTLNAEALEAETHRRLALYDQLTGIGNRRALSKLSEEENLEFNRDWTVICIDLNDLKLTNDTIGHNTGDRLLRSFAFILNKTCKQVPGVSCYRTGGDEFVVILLNNLNKDYFMNQLASRVGLFNEDEKQFQISYGIGCATGDEAPTSDLVLDLADRRMYTNKNKVKSSK